MIPLLHCLTQSRKRLQRCMMKMMIMMEVQLLLFVQNEFEDSPLHRPAETENPTTQWRPWKSAALQNVLKHLADPWANYEGEGLLGANPVAQQLIPIFPERLEEDTMAWVDMSFTNKAIQGAFPHAPDGTPGDSTPAPQTLKSHMPYFAFQNRKLKKNKKQFCMNIHPLILQVCIYPSHKQIHWVTVDLQKYLAYHGYVAQKAPCPDWATGTSAGPSTHSHGEEEIAGQPDHPMFSVSFCQQFRWRNLLLLLSTYGRQTPSTGLGIGVSLKRTTKYT